MESQKRRARGDTPSKQRPLSKRLSRSHTGLAPQNLAPRFRAITLEEPSSTDTIVTKKGKVLSVVPKAFEPLQQAQGNTRKNAVTKLSNEGKETQLTKKCQSQGIDSTAEATTTAWQYRSNQPTGSLLSLSEIMRQEKQKQQKAKIASLPLVAPNDFKEIIKNLDIIQDLLLCSTKGILLLFSIPKAIVDQPYTLQDIDVSTWEDYDHIKNLFFRTMLSYKMTSIKRIVNPFLLASYDLKKEQNDDFEEKLLFHGTLLENVDSICIDNFDWRMVTKHKYGWGVSFSSTPYYASHYGDQSSKSKVMFAAKVLVGLEWKGDCNTEVPQKPYDTTTNTNGRVFVKYDDASFYPAYVIYYEKKQQ